MQYHIAAEINSDLRAGARRSGKASETKIIFAIGEDGEHQVCLLFRSTILRKSNPNGVSSSGPLYVEHRRLATIGHCHFSVGREASGRSEKGTNPKKHIWNSGGRRALGHRPALMGPDNLGHKCDIRHRLRERRHWADKSASQTCPGERHLQYTDDGGRHVSGELEIRPSGLANCLEFVH